MGFKLNKNKLSNLVFFGFLLLLLIPTTRGMIQIFLTRLVAFSPSTIQQEDRQQLSSYNWSLHGVNAKNLNFETAKDKVVLINFWATWCPPCIAEMPSMQELYNKYQDKVLFLFVTNETDSDINKFMVPKHYDFPVYRAVSNIPPLLFSESLPTTYLIDKDGAIVIQKTGAADWNSNKVHETIDGLLGE